ncbi:MAG: double-strand break repair helicase AddA [Pseudomonadota bacterium]
MSHEAVIAQRDAAAPARSVWVSANAGSGKTRVLTERVARLLLADAAPDKILCLTYTKAAAAEMQTRLFSMLGGWAMAEDEALAADLAELTGRVGFVAEELDKARRLFAQALETPGGLKIQTIHAFCDGILRRFPLEADTPPQFRVMDDREKEALIASLLNDMAADGARGGAEVFAAVVEDRNEGGLEELAAAVIGARDLFREAATPSDYAAAFGIPDPPDRDTARFAAIKGMDLKALWRMIAAWRSGTATESAMAEGIAAAVTAGGSAFVAPMTKSVLTAKFEPRKRMATKAAQAAEPDHEALCAHLVEIALAAREAEAAAEAAMASLRLYAFGCRLTADYDAAKRRSGLLDFDDLVGKTRALLTRSDAAAWVLYRLDGGVDHILVDEAQDTSRAQWDVINEIAREFRAGEGARDVARTSFVVGDEKQSIYRFQGAAPEMFDEMRARFRADLEGAGGQLERELAYSFRSAPAILGAVDCAFREDRATGLTAAGVPPDHRAFFDDRAGRVELWPVTEDDPDPPPPEPWAPVDAPSPRSARLKLVAEVVKRIAAMVGREPLPGGGRMVEAGDVIVLLRARAPMMGPLVRGLKAAGVPVAGADRLRLTDELAVKDLIALLRFAATAADDLSLAAVLRSPLFGVTEDELFDLAHPRKGTLWDEVRRGDQPEIAGRLSKLRDAVGYQRPFELLQMALVDWDGRRRFLARLGEEAEDAIDELLAQALAFEERETPSVEAFLAMLDGADLEVKRQQAGRSGQVRVMTAHGAKGLEAPVVILPDTMRKPEGARGWRIAEVDGPSSALPAMVGPKPFDPKVIAERRALEEQAAADEFKRLLYVAMTRAEDWLIIAGAGDPEKTEDTWYDLARSGLIEAGAEERDGALILESGTDPKTAAAPDRLAPPGAARPLPTLAPSVKGPRRKAASGLLTADYEARGGDLAPEIAARRGEAIHAILEAGIEEVTEASRIARGFDLPEDLIAPLAAEALRARALPEAARFFGEASIAEAPVSVLIGDDRIAGRIDRLIVTEEEVAFVDFKSDAAPPPPGETPAEYAAQFAAYRAALAGIYPGRSITAHMLWTAAPRLDAIEEASMDAALAQATAS